MTVEAEFDARELAERVLDDYLAYTGTFPAVVASRDAGLKYVGELVVLDVRRLAEGRPRVDRRTNVRRAT